MSVDYRLKKTDSANQHTASGANASSQATPVAGLAHSSMTPT